MPHGTTNQSELALRGFIPTGETAMFVTAEGDYYQAPIADLAMNFNWPAMTTNGG